MKLFEATRWWGGPIPSSRSEKSDAQLDLKIGRRGASVAMLSLISAIAATVTTRPARAKEQPTAKARIAAPKDCFVVEVLATHGAHVSKGEKIAILDSEEEDQIIERISMAMQFLDLQEESISESQIKVRKEILESTLGVAQSYLTYAKVRMDPLALGTEIGQMPPPGVLEQSKAAVVRAEAEVKRAGSALELFDFNVSQARSKLKIIKEAVPKEQQAANLKKKRLELIAPISGHVSVLCYKGAFVKKGDILAEVF